MLVIHIKMTTGEETYDTNVKNWQRFEQQTWCWKWKEKQMLKCEVELDKFDEWPIVVLNVEDKMERIES